MISRLVKPAIQELKACRTIPIGKFIVVLMNKASMLALSASSGLMSLDGLYIDAVCLPLPP